MLHVTTYMDFEYDGNTYNVAKIVSMINDSEDLTVLIKGTLDGEIGFLLRQNHNTGDVTLQRIANPEETTSYEERATTLGMQSVNDVKAY